MVSKGTDLLLFDELRGSCAGFTDELCGFVGQSRLDWTACSYATLHGPQKRVGSVRLIIVLVLLYP
jgi:hypothetical protein